MIPLKRNRLSTKLIGVTLLYGLPLVAAVGILLFLQLRQTQQDDIEMFLIIGLVLVSFFLIALLVIAIVNRLIMRRLMALLKGTQAIAAGDLTVRVAPQGEDELGQLALSFNEMTEQLAAARTELEEQVARRTQELAALVDVTAVASASLDLDEVLNQSLVQVVTVMNGRNGSIHLFDESQQTLKLAAAYNVPPAILPEIEEVPVGSPGSVVGRVPLQDEPLYVPVIAKEVASVPAAIRELPQNSFLGTPMRAKGKAIGVLGIIGKANQLFSREEIALVAAIADQVGVAVESARLYQQAEALAVVEERQRLARELHDAVTQSIYSATLLAATGQRAAAAEDWPEVVNFLERLQTITGQALKELRLLVYELRPSALENAGLVEALQHRLDAVEHRAGIQTQLLVDDIQLDEAQEMCLYRVAVEALNNALKHAAATAVTVHLSAQNGHISLTVQDNGQGFDLETAGQRGGIGLHSMAERVEQVGGALTIKSVVGEGTAVRVEIGRLEIKD